MRPRRLSLVLIAVASMLPLSDVVAGEAGTPLSARLPLFFEENGGQVDARVRFLAQGPGYVAFLTEAAAVLRLEPRGEETPGAALYMTLVGAEPRAELRGEASLPGRSHYLGAAERSEWITGVRHFREVWRRGVYPGIDVAYRADRTDLAYDFVLAPGADPGRIAFSFAGADGLSLGPDGSLHIETPAGTLVQRGPYAYQEQAGERSEVASAFALRADGSVGFRVGAFDRTRTLVIDPTFEYSTLMGPTSSGTGSTAGYAIAVDEDGAAYVAGVDGSTSFPSTPGAFDPTPTGTFVAKLDPTGSFLEYSTHLGDDITAIPRDIALSADGHALVVGAGRPPFRTPNAIEDDIPPFGAQAYVVELDATGSDLLYSTFLPGQEQSSAASVAVGPGGLVYVLGEVQGNLLGAITPDAYQLSNPVGVFGFSGFVVILDTHAPADPDPAVEGESLVYGTHFAPHARPQDLAVDAAGNVVFWGQNTGGIPMKNAIQPTPAGNGDPWIAKLDPSLAGADALVFSTYVGGSGTEIIGARQGGIALGPSGDIYLVGRTESVDFPTTAGAFSVVNGGGADAFVTRIAADGSAIVYSTFLGGALSESAYDVAVDSAGRAFVVGNTASFDFPIVDGIQTTRSNSIEGFVSALLPDGSGLVYSTYLGSGDSDGCNGIAVDALGAMYVTGGTGPSTLPRFPTTPGAFQEIAVGGSAYVSKLPPVAPVADAGADQTVDEGEPVTLDGTASSAGVSYQWVQIAGPPVVLDDDTSPTPSFTAPFVSGNVTLTFQLVVDDGTSMSEPDTVDVTIVNVNNPPVADAGDDSTIKEGAEATLDASASFDPEGDTPLGYAWTQLAGPAVVLSPGPDVLSPSFTAPLGVGSVLEFEVVVDDGREASAPDAVLVTIVENSPPVADAGPDQMVDEGTLVQLAGSGSDPDGGDTVSFAWSQLSGPVVVLSNPSSPSPSFDAPSVAAGGEDVALELTVTDDDPVNPLSDSDEVVVSVRDVNDPPDCDGAFASESFLWPPDHKMQEISILGVMDPDSPTNTITIEITAVTQDEPVNGLGDGDSSPDAVIQQAEGADSVLIRRERAGPGDGRVYVIEFTASDGVDGCTGTVVLESPANRRGDPAVDSGQLYDSTIP